MRTRNFLLLLLTLAAGCVDTIAYIGLDVFPANMTGNTVLLGLALGRAQGVAVAHASLALAGFLAGAALGTLIAGGRPDKTLWPRGVTAALVVEWLLLSAFAGIWYGAGPLEANQAALWALIVVSALAMGLQSVIAIRLGVAGVTTTYVTGTLTNLIIQLVSDLRPAPAGPGASPSQGAAPKAGALLLAGTWLMYILGAAIAATAFRFGPHLALGFPVVALTVVLLIGVLRLRGR